MQPLCCFIATMDYLQLTSNSFVYNQLFYNPNLSMHVCNNTESTSIRLTAFPVQNNPQTTLRNSFTRLQWFGIKIATRKELRIVQVRKENRGE